MKIIIDAYQHSPAITGTDRMASNYLAELQKLDTANEYTILCSKEDYIPSSIFGSNFHIIKPPSIASLPIVSKYISYIWRRVTKVRLIKRRADVYYSFHNMQLPGRKVAKRMITSNLDLIPLVLDDYKNLGRATYDEQTDEFHRVASLANEIISISEFSKAELCERLGVPENKVEVVHLAADPSFQSVNDNSNELHKLGIDDNYIFTMGGTEPRKNVTSVIDAYLKLPDTIKNNYRLVIAGGEWHGRKLEELRKDPNIITLGFVPDELLPVLYGHASVFVFASEYEGFGFAILEAMSCGTPVISATGTSLDEVAGDASLKFNPHDTTKLTHEIQRVLTDEKLREELTKLGTKQASKFSWEVSAKKLHSILTEPNSSPE